MRGLGTLALNVILAMGEGPASSAADPASLSSGFPWHLVVEKS